MPCTWSDPRCTAWDVEGAILRSAGGVVPHFWSALGALDSILSAPTIPAIPETWLPFAGESDEERLCPWGGAIVNEWSRETGRTKAEVLTLFANAARRATRAERGNE